ncbi:MAG: hypothetical protein AAFP77_28610 [Bacteroidota bacterium]
MIGERSSQEQNNAMFFTPFNIQCPNATAQLSLGEVAFFVSRGSSWQCCFDNGYNSRGQRNFPAMRDQHFQDLMRKFDKNLQDDGPGNASKSQSKNYRSAGEAKSTIVEELDSQSDFKQFLKRSLPNRKPSSEFIQSIKDRIKTIE